MARPVRIHAEFLDDLEGQLDWLRHHRDGSWIDGFEVGIDEAIALLAAHPAAGAAHTLAAGAGEEVRRLILRRLPFVVWYAVDLERKDGEAWLLRLFFVRQDRPRTERKGRRG